MNQDSLELRRKKQNLNHFGVLIRLLRDRKTFLEEVRGEVKLNRKISSLLVASTCFFAVYGAIFGSFSGGLQIISSAIKLPALYLITLAICVPTLYFFDIL
ncbi:MAG: actin-binding WH2 domain-containing protein, partial [Cyanobacteria bacterium J06621_11]